MRHTNPVMAKKAFIPLSYSQHPTNTVNLAALNKLANKIRMRFIGETNLFAVTGRVILFTSYKSLSRV
jgi:hypothetical protein